MNWDRLRYRLHHHIDENTEDIADVEIIYTILAEDVRETKGKIVVKGEDILAKILPRT